MFRETVAPPRGFGTRVENEPLFFSIESYRGRSGFPEVDEYLAGVLIGREYWIEDFLDSAFANDETEPSDAYWRN